MSHNTLPDLSGVATADLVEHIGLAQSTVSKHLSFLLECRLVVVRPDGRSSWYALSRPEALAGLIAAAERLLDATGTKAELCAHLRHPARHPGRFSGAGDTGSTLHP